MTVRKILIYLPKTLAHKIIYYLVIWQSLDLNNPTDLNQKIHYMVVYRYGDFEAKLLDKYTVKEYVNSLGIKDLFVAQLYALFDNVNQIDLDKLPNRFVLKTTHGCGDTVICLDKAIFDLNSAKKNLYKALKQNQSRLVCEYFSMNVTRAIICEEYIDDDTGINPIDYKLLCFHGKAKYILVCTERDIKTRLYLFDTDWNYLDWCLDEFKGDVIIQKPDNLNRIIEIAEELATPFPFVRIDLYNARGKIYFGEFTFTPANGIIRYFKSPYLKVMGDLLDLKRVNNG